MNSNSWQQTAMEQWQKWRQERPLWMIWASIAIAFLFYYLLIILSSAYFVGNLQERISSSQAQAEWMAKAASEILRLRQAMPHQREKTTASTYTLVDKAINEQGWNNIVTDVHQVEQHRVEVNFNAVSFNELIAWLNKLFDKDGIYVLEATLKKSQPGIVQTTLILQQDLQ